MPAFLPPTGQASVQTAIQKHLFENTAVMPSWFPYCPTVDAAIHTHGHCFMLRTAARHKYGQIFNCSTYHLLTLISLFHLRAGLSRGVFPSDFLKSWVMQTIGRDMAQAVSGRSPTAEDRVRSRVSPCGICGGQSGTGTGFSLEYFGFLLLISFHRCSITCKNEKNWSPFSSSSSQGLHNKP
jgi:hypothetical protein